MAYEDILFERSDRTVDITINRPHRMNSLRVQTVEELLDAFSKAGAARDVGSIVLSGAGTSAFCVGGDQKEHHARGASYGGRGTLGLPIEELQSIIRDVPQPVIAKVRGTAVGAGNVLCALCDLTLAAESAHFGQVGPKVGSVDPGWGSAYLARCVGEKKAREMWYLCRRYTAREALAMGLVNAVVPDDRLDEETRRWCAEINEMSPTAITIAKRSFNADSENIRGIGSLGMQAVKLYYESAEAREGVSAFVEKRRPDFWNNRS